MAFQLPELPYAYDALEPHIDARTMEMHHTRHHAGYVAKLNAALEGVKGFDGKSVEEILRNIKTVPEAYLLGDRALYLAAYNAIRDAISPDGLMNDAGVRIAVAAVASYNDKVKPAEIDIARTYTNDFVRKALQKIK